jgi:hypothetical protein
VKAQRFHLAAQKVALDSRFYFLSQDFVEIARVAFPFFILFRAGQRDYGGRRESAGRGSVRCGQFRQALYA